jgi:hypothetical protein
VKRLEWSDKQLEELLRQMPKIEDHRNPRDIYQNLSLKKRKYPVWLLPGIATAAAVLLFFLLIPKIIDGTQFSYDRAGDAKSSNFDKIAFSTESNQKSTITLEKRATNIEEKQSSNAVRSEVLQSDHLKTAVYEDEVGTGTVLTYWIPDQQAEMLVPISAIVQDNKNKNWLTLFNEKMNDLKEEDLGLSDFYPINAKIQLDNSDNSVIVDVPENHSYGHGSTNETNFLNVMKKDVFTNSKIKKIKFKTNGHSGIELGDYGKKTEINIELDNNHAYFFYYPKENTIPFLVPSLGRYKDIKMAIKAMEKDVLSGDLKASLPPSLYIKNASIKGKTLYLTMNKNTTLINDRDTLHSFEALLLTAKEFGMESVMIENAPLPYLGSFDLTKEVKVPLAPNLRLLQ